MKKFLKLLARGFRHRDALAQAGLEWRIVSIMTTRPQWAREYNAALESGTKAMAAQRASPVVLRRVGAPALTWGDN